MNENNKSIDYFLVSDHTKTFRLNKNAKNTIGRDDSCNIVLKNMLVSRSHAEVIWENNSFYIKDNQSQNGTTVNGESITKIRLVNGDIINIGLSDQVRYIRSDETIA